MSISTLVKGFVLGTLLSISGCSLIPFSKPVPPTVITAKVVVPVVRKVVVPDKPMMPLVGASAKEPLDVLMKKALSEIELRKAYELLLEDSINACNEQGTVP